MGKKKKFIDKKAAASFHIIHRTTENDHDNDKNTTTDALAALAINNNDNNSTSTSLTTSAILSANTTTAATSVTTTTATSSTSSRYYLQPSYSLSNCSINLPIGFPVDLLLVNNEDREYKLYLQDQKLKRQREAEANNPAVLPHDYDYLVHMKEITGTGVFISATNNDTRYRSTRINPEVVPEPRELDAEVDLSMVAAIESTSQRMKRKNRSVQLPNDMAAILAEDNDDKQQEDEELEDDFVLKAMKGSLEGEEEQDDHVVEEDQDEDEDIEWDIEEEEEEQQEEDEQDEKDRMEETKENKEEVDDDIENKEYVKSMRHQIKQHRNDKTKDNEEYDEEYDDFSLDGEHGHTNTALDSAFDALLEADYDDDFIGGLDDANDDILNGLHSLDSFHSAIDDFLERRGKSIGDGGSVIEMDPKLKSHIKMHLYNALRKQAELDDNNDTDTAANRKSLNDMLDAEFARIDKGENWDCESILSTYSNTENHPNTIKEQTRQRNTKKVKPKSHQPQMDIHTLLLSTPSSISTTAPTSVPSISVVSVPGIPINLGVGRSRGETAAEKSARKSAYKALRREQREKKKAIKSLYHQIDQQQQKDYTKQIIHNPTAKTIV